MRSAGRPLHIASLLTLTLLFGLGSAGCAGDDGGDDAGASLRAEATLAELGGSGVAGTVDFKAVDGGVEITATISGLPPGMKHGFHIHEKGDCSAADGTSAGGHLNPEGVDHGAPGDDPSHAGDLGNLNADDAGAASYSFVSSKLSLGDGGPADVVGRAVIVHAGVDDLMTQPTGDAGGRIACAVIILPND